MWSYLPWLLLLACPVMMIFMMRGMGGMRGGHDQGVGHRESPQDKPASRDDAGAGQRIVDLERQVAELRAERDRFGGPARRP